MPSVGYDLWFFPESSDFGESVARSELVVPLPPDTVILKAVYLREEDITSAGLEKARGRLASRDLQGEPDVFPLRLVHSTDGPPLRAALIYQAVQTRLDALRYESRVENRFAPTHKAPAILYGAIRARTAHGWEEDFSKGRDAYFLTGGGLTELWRLGRLEVDALHRQVLTLAPARSPYRLAVPQFVLVRNTRLCDYLGEQFDAFQRAVGSGSHLEIVDRAANIAEAVLDYCLTQISQPVPRTLGERLGAARSVIEDKTLRKDFPLTNHAYYLAQKVRELHSRIHADQAVERGRTVRPEVGLGVAIDLSELLVEVGLARY